MAGTKRKKNWELALKTTDGLTWRENVEVLSWNKNLLNAYGKKEQRRSHNQSGRYPFSQKLPFEE